METFTTACPRNCYSTCSLRVHVDQGRVVGVEGHPANRATPGGPCLKAIAAVEQATSPERLRSPLVRTAAGRFRKAGWDEVLDLLEARLRRLRADPGPRSVLVVEGSGTKGLLNGVTSSFWRMYGGCTTTYGDLCWPAGLEATRLTLGKNVHNAPWDLARARTIVLWGKNPAETNVHQMTFVHDARRAGAEVVVVDPRRTQSAEAADLLIQPKPGTDGALALSVAAALIADGLVDTAFVDQYVHGFSEFAALADTFPPERTASVTGVPPAAVRRLAVALATRRPATICAGFGMQRYSNSGQTVRAIIALLALTGNIGRPGAGWMYANLASHVFSSPGDPLAFYPPDDEDTTDGPRIAVSMARLGHDMAALDGPPVRMAWIERGNPAVQCPDSPSVVRALRSLDFRVVTDLFLTDTAREADVVLPAKTMFEQSDVITAYWHPYVQLRRRVVDPPAGVLPETEVYRRLAHRLGFEPAAVEEELPASDDDSIEAFLARRLAPFPELGLDRLRNGPALAPGWPEVAFADLDFATPSGRIELHSAEAVRRWDVDALPLWRPPAERPGAGDAPPLQLLTPNSANRVHSQLVNVASARRLEGPPAVSIAPADAAARRVADGDLVRVFNRRGELRLPARIDAGLRPGCVSIPNGWWRADGAAVNLLSAARETDMGHGAAFHDTAVDVERAE